MPILKEALNSERSKRQVLTISIALTCLLMLYLAYLSSTRKSKEETLLIGNGIISKKNGKLRSVKLNKNLAVNRRKLAHTLVSREKGLWNAMDKGDNPTDGFKYDQNEERLLTLFTYIEKDEMKDAYFQTTVLNWPQLKPFITPVLFTNDVDYSDLFREQGWIVLPLPFPKQNGRPTMKYMFLEVMKKIDSLFYGYSNIDTLFTHSLSANLQLVSDCYQSNDHVLIVGKTHDIAKLSRRESETLSDLVYVSRKKGQRSRFDEINYFITDKNYDWDSMKAVPVDTQAIGNWVVFEAQLDVNTKVIEASDSILAVRQLTHYAVNKKLKTKDKRVIESILKTYYGKKTHFLKGTIECADYKIAFSESGHLCVVKKKFITYKCDVQDFVLSDIAM